VHRLLPPPTSRRGLAAKIAEIARIGALFIDGDYVEAIFASGAEWTSGDDINFAHAPYIDVKRTVLRIERIGPFRCFATVVRLRTDDRAKAEAVVCGMRNVLGIKPVTMTPAMRRCVRDGEVTTERIARSGQVRAYAPICSSDGDPVGFLMVHA